VDEQHYNKVTERASRNTITDEEMVQRYENLVGLPRGPSQGLRATIGAAKKENRLSSKDFEEASHKMIKLNSENNFKRKNLPSSTSNNNCARKNNFKRSKK
jgi:hypothetical protein